MVTSRTHLGGPIALFLAALLWCCAPTAGGGSPQPKEQYGGGRGCTAADCDSGVRGSYNVHLPHRTDVNSLEVRLCRNGACAGCTPRVAGAMLSCHVDAPLHMRVLVVPTPNSSLVRLEVQFTARDEELRDGDQYEVRLKQAGAAPVVLSEVKMRYIVDQPNGPECEPTCRNGLLPALDPAQP